MMEPTIPTSIDILLDVPIWAYWLIGGVITLLPGMIVWLWSGSKLAAHLVVALFSIPASLGNYIPWWVPIALAITVVVHLIYYNVKTA